MSTEVLDLDILAEVLFEQGLDALIADLEGDAGTSHVLDVLRDRRDVLLERPWELAVQMMAALGHLQAFGPELSAAKKQTPISLRHGFLQGGEPEPLHTLHEHKNFVGGLVFTPDGSEFYSSSEDGSVRRWVIGRPDSAEVLKHGSPVNRLRIDRDGKNLLLAGDDQTIQLWSLDHRDHVATLNGHSGYVSKLEPLPDGRIISVSADGSVKIWDQSSGACVATFGDHHRAWVFAIAVSPDGKRAVTSSLNQTMIAWDLDQLEVEQVIIGKDNGDVHMVMGNTYLAAPNTSGRGHDDAPSVMRWSANGERLISASKDIVVWNATSFEEVARFAGHAWKINDMHLFDEDRKLVTVAHCIKIWDMETGEELRSFLGHNSDEIYSAALSPDESLLITADKRGVIKIWDLGSILAEDIEIKHMGQVDTLVVSPDSRHALSSSSDKTGILWDLETGKARHMLTGHRDLFVTAQAFTAGGEEAVTTCSGELFFWNVEDGERVRAYRHHNKLYGFEGLTFYDDERKAIIGDTIRSLYYMDLEDADARAVKLKGRTAFCNQFAWSKDGRFMLSNCYFNKSDDYDWDDDGERTPRDPDDPRPFNTGVQRWDVERLELDREYYPEVLRGTSEDTEYPSKILFDEGRDLLISGSSRGPIHIWRYESGEFLGELRGHPEYILLLGMNEAGHLISVGQNDPGIRIWDPETRTQLREIVCPYGKMFEPVVFSNGRYLAAYCTPTWDLLAFFDLEEGRLLATYTHSCGLSTLAPSADGSFLVVGDKNGNAFVIDVALEGSRSDWLFVAS